MGQFNSTGYSAAVRLWLRVQDRMIELSHAASTFVVAKQAVDLPAGDAEIVYQVDAERYERPVRLIYGMSGDRRETMVLSRDQIPF